MFKKTRFSGGPHPFVYPAFGYVMQPSFSIQIRAVHFQQPNRLHFYIYIYMAPLPPALVYFVFPYLLGFWVNFLKSLWLPIATRDTGLTNQAQRFHENQPFNGHLFLA